MEAQGRHDHRGPRLRTLGRERAREGMVFELFAEDVTERRALEQQLRQSQKMEAVGRLAGGIAHDFNNLLMVISGYSEFLLERLGAEPHLRGPAQEIASAAERASSLTRQLLAFSRKQMLAPQIVNLNDVVTENLKMLTRLIGEDIDLVMVPSPNLWPVRADAGQIEQVIMNLAVNARDAMPSGGKLTIETSNVTLDEDYARFHAPAAARRLRHARRSATPAPAWTPRRSRTSSNRSSPPRARREPASACPRSTASSSRAAATSGSTAKWAGARPSRSTCRASRPRAKTSAAQARRRRSSSAKSNPAPKPSCWSRTKPTCVTSPASISKSRATRSSKPPTARSPCRLRWRTRKSIHLLLTDVIMPGMNGRELAQRIAEIRPNVKILYMSGYTENVIGHNGMLDAGIRLLQKPFNLRDLKSMVREVLDATNSPGGRYVRRIPPHHSAPRAAREIPPTRAQRFQLHLPLRYRRLGENDWHVGTTENISRSGMLFQADEALQPNSQLEINLVLPQEIAGLSATEVVCRGEVVRTVEQNGTTLTPALAARILQYHFQHGPLPRA